jgi:hypothetical protein
MKEIKSEKSVTEKKSEVDVQGIKQKFALFSIYIFLDILRFFHLCLTEFSISNTERIK